MINVIGLGYIGLPTALMLASHGQNVVGTDVNENLINKLNCGEVTFREEGLKSLLENAIKQGILFSKEYQRTDMYIVSVPTPYDSVSKKVDPRFVVKAVKTILDYCEGETIIVIESTISPGTIDKYVRPLLREDKVKDKVIHLVHAPERIIPGNMIYELVNNNRTIGADEKDIGEYIRNIYAQFCKGTIVVTDIKTAEMTKVVENTFRAVNIAFANELTRICRLANVDIYEIIRICNMHPRVNILQPGPGVGGHCISIDPWFLVGDYPQSTELTNIAMKINSGMPEYVLNRIYTIIQERGILDLNQVGLYGLTYKENVDDYRESPTLQLLECQKQHLGIPLKVYDPYIIDDIVENQYHDLATFIDSVDMVVIMVGHDEIKENITMLSDKVILDCKNISPYPDTYHI